MDVLVIGNGFDLAHGLKTSYKDFLEACHKMSLQEAVDGKADYKKLCDTNLWMKHFITRQKQLGDTWIDLENEIFKVLQSIHKNIMNLSQGELWCFFPLKFSIKKDISQFNLDDIAKYLQTTQEDYPTGQKKYISLETNDFPSIFIENYKGLINFLYDQLRIFTQAFEKYLMYDVLTQITPAIKYNFPLQAPNRAVHVLSFNYTDTYERLYKTKSMYDDSKSVYVYVHGKAGKSDDCNLVLGTHSFDNTTIPVDFNVFKKHHQRHRYGTIEEYQDFIKRLKETGIVTFHVIGHSLNNTDKNILKHVFITNKNSVINIYWHDEETQEKLMTNITEIIGEEEVMSKVRLIYQHDEKRGLLRKTKSLVQSAS